MSATSRSASLPIAPALEGGPRLPVRVKPIDGRILTITALAVGLAIVAAAIAHGLGLLIRGITDLCFHHQWSFANLSAEQTHLGAWVIPIPIVGGLIVGLMARYGSRAIRGHGIPEAMEQILTNQSRIPARMAILKPLSAAIAIGTGGPFGAEGPIIASGGSLGSLVGQVLRTSPAERRTLLAAGAAAGMAATFGAPVSAVLLAIELLLFEYRARSLIPVCCAAATAASARLAWAGSAPMFAMPDPPQAQGWSLASYALIGALAGVGAMLATRAVYAVERAFERTRIDWMWWPALGGAVVGLMGWIDPRILGVGYGHISALLGGGMPATAAAALILTKGIAWSVALGSGTSGGTLAPLFTIGGAFGVLCGQGMLMLWPQCGVDAHLAALVGMAALFAGASRALLASMVFAFETTHAASGVLPLLVGCSMAYLIASWHSRTSIMTEKIARRGIPVAEGYASHPLDRVRAGERCTRAVVSFAAGTTVAVACAALADGRHRHQAFPVLDPDGRPVGVLTRHQILAGPREQPLAKLITRGPVMVATDHSLHEAVDLLLAEGVGRLLVVSPEPPRRLVGILTRSDILSALAELQSERQPQEPSLTVRSLLGSGAAR